MEMKHAGDPSHKRHASDVEDKTKAAPRDPRLVGIMGQIGSLQKWEAENVERVLQEKGALDFILIFKGTDYAEKRMLQVLVEDTSHHDQGVYEPVMRARRQGFAGNAEAWANARMLDFFKQRITKQELADAVKAELVRASSEKVGAKEVEKIGENAAGITDAFYERGEVVQYMLWHFNPDTGEREEKKIIDENGTTALINVLTRRLKWVGEGGERATLTEFMQMSYFKEAKEADFMLSFLPPEKYDALYRGTYAKLVKGGEIDAAKVSEEQYVESRRGPNATTATRTNRGTGKELETIMFNGHMAKELDFASLVSFYFHEYAHVRLNHQHGNLNDPTYLFVAEGIAEDARRNAMWLLDRMHPDAGFAVARADKDSMIGMAPYRVGRAFVSAFREVGSEGDWRVALHELAEAARNGPDAVRRCIDKWEKAFPDAIPADNK